MTDIHNTKVTIHKSKNTNKASSFLAKIKAKSRSLSPEETREILTPFAFKIDQSLFGISLAVPWRRGCALLIDLFFIAILSGAPGELLALLVAVTLFKVGGKKHAEKFGKKLTWRKAMLRFIGAFIVFVVLLDTLPGMFSQMDEFNHNVEQAGQKQVIVSKVNNPKAEVVEDNSFIKATLTVASALAISQSDCETQQCWQQLTTDLATGYVQQSSSDSDNEQFVLSLVTGVEERNVLTNEQIAQLKAQLQQVVESEIARPQATDNVTVDLAKAVQNEEESPETSQSLEKPVSSSTSIETSETADNDSNTNSGNSTVYKGFAWLQGLIEDLGIGFGWAAFYFTMFTAIWYGQTPGKKLLSIRVIQLDGTELSIWDSFGRYGGYGAGIATGLLGFAQIYWDPNRQAIHDKISATIVINDKATHDKNTAEPQDENKGEPQGEQKVEKKGESKSVDVGEQQVEKKKSNSLG